MATRTKRLRLLTEAYATLPSVECKGLCWETCSFINLEDVEILHIETATGRPVKTVEIMNKHMLEPTGVDGDRCPYLQLQRCSIYEQRPTICRLFGVARGLECRHGCRPTRLVGDDEATALLRRIRKL
jgi:Fe-S-cluster containining protein